MNILNPDDYRLVILPGQNLPHDSLRPLYNQAYQNWKRVWKRIINRLDGPGTYRSDAFSRQNFVSTIFYKDQICCQTTARLFRLDEDWTYDSAYFDIFTDKTVSYLRSQNANSLMSIEHNSINAQFSKRKTGFEFVEAMLRLQLKMAQELSLDACLGVTRNITGVQDTGRAIGFRTIETNLEKHNCPVEIQFADLSMVADHPDDFYRQFISQLWETRLDYRIPISFENKPRFQTAG